MAKICRYLEMTLLEGNRKERQGNATMKEARVFVPPVKHEGGFSLFLFIDTSGII